MRLIKNNKKGDTIIEVLICLAVLGFILVVAYSITSRALASVRASQERVEALKIAEGQLEQLKSLTNLPDTDANSIFGLGFVDDFCLQNRVVRKFTPSGTKPPADAGDDDFGTYPGECKNLPPTDGQYNVYITPPNPATPDGGLYVVRVRWNSYGGSNVNDEVKLEYKLFKEAP